MSDTATARVRLEIRESLAFLTLARPEVQNTMNLEFGREFLAAAFAIEAAPAVRAVILTGQGKNFCFGGDLKGMAASGIDVGAYLSELTTNLHAGMALLARLDAPVIAAVNGTAAGAGLGLVLAADLAIAARSAKFAPAYTGVGLTPDAGCTFLLPRAVGYKRAMELMLTNRILDAEQALNWGLINQVVDDERLAETAAALAARLAAGPVGAFGAVKRLLAEAEPGFESQLARESRSIALRGMTAEGREGIAAFLEKRAPIFRD
ncbi:MAG TPA: enoyl-CoA hydratase-related protein [Steroidobacteraceae bacterium]|jgi:2-(1,2-epoxy-1,2-dihydrophenyl)acetyl-CoA isomerase|nr:enoyl-CoA hydratase-related protein [Steroidobacteraceae bacterium]